MYVDFNGATSDIRDTRPWFRIQYKEDKYAVDSPWTKTGTSKTDKDMAYSGDFKFVQDEVWIDGLLESAIDVRQRFGSLGFDSVGWTYGGGHQEAKGFNKKAYTDWGTGTTLFGKEQDTRPRHPSISFGVSDFNAFNNPTAKNTDPTDRNDNEWRASVFYFRNTGTEKILPVRGIYNSDVNGGGEKDIFFSCQPRKIKAVQTPV